MDSKFTSNPNDFQYEILPEKTIEYDLSFKVIVIGDTGVGKSCLTVRGIKNVFENVKDTTIGFEFFTLMIKFINEQQIIKLQIWDTCGQEIYRSLVTNFYRSATLAFIVYSLDNYQSFKNIDVWLREIRTNSSPEVKIILIGNKKDLEDER